MNPGVVADPASGSAPGWVTALVVHAGTLTVQRRSSAAEYRARLTHTAHLLARCERADVERFVALEHTASTTTLVTGHLGGRSLRAAAPLQPRILGEIAAQVLRTLGALHAAGITHGPLSSGSVRLAADGSVALCGFVDGQVRAGAPEHRWRAWCAADVRSVGRMLRTLQGPPGAAWLPGRGPRLARLATQLAVGEIVDAEVAARRLQRAAPWRRRVS